jgi:hypothetical protein
MDTALPKAGVQAQPERLICLPSNDHQLRPRQENPRKTHKILLPFPPTNGKVTKRQEQLDEYQIAQHVA